MLKKTLLVQATLLITLSLGSACAQSPVLDPTTQQFLDASSAAHLPPLYALSPKEARATLDNLQKSKKVVEAPAAVQDTQLAVGPTGTTRIRIYRPVGDKGTLPVLVYFHGAGWVMGGPITHDRLMRDLVSGSHAVVIFVDYERSPEARYPVPVEQDYAVLHYVADHPKEFRIDPTHIAIGGDSAGGNMVAVVAQLDRERRGPALVAQVLFYPVTDALLSQPSQKQFANGPYLNHDAMVYFLEQYLGPDVDRSQPHVSPLNAPLEALRGQPPALVITDENDVLRDEGEAYARKLTEAGVPTTSTRYNGTFHDFVMLNALAETPATRAAIGQANLFLREAFRSK